MRRGLVHVLAWLLATGAAVTLSWWGVHTVMAGTAYDPPRALPITAADVTARESEPPASSSTRRPSPSASASPTPGRTPRAQPSPTPSRTAPATATAPAAPGSSPTGSGRVRSYDTDGGRAVFDLGTSSASLVSATPGTGWSMQVWKTETWIRVEFTSGADRVSVFCTWHDGPPRVEIGSY
ncbi:hypothetical protein H0H10_16250 [Streptomyces sp. TRM S81-3]|uniref:Secreted protein n=1 Tax=Streptomyces griseicoloratus TaxID=2752516 RepID=A0A926L5W2_9ACTN|nr:hypothetical protein [Streptomyces griseicoloratus]MBD0420678.1 hypothetical protein [Streptomyces griseicoloratus]